MYLHESSLLFISRNERRSVFIRCIADRQVLIGGERLDWSVFIPVGSRAGAWRVLTINSIDLELPCSTETMAQCMSAC